MAYEEQILALLQELKNDRFCNVPIEESNQHRAFIAVQGNVNKQIFESLTEIKVELNRLNLLNERIIKIETEKQTVKDSASRGMSGLALVIVVVQVLIQIFIKK